MRKPLVLVVLVLAAVALCLAGETAAQKGPIKVGLLVPQTGPLAGNGKDMINGFELFFEQVGYKLAGRGGEDLAAMITTLERLAGLGA